MSIYPQAEYRPLAAEQGQPVLTPTIILLHTMVGNLTSTDRMFKANGWTGTESHFGIGGRWGDGLDGVVYQWQDTGFRADANLGGNHRVISIETGDNAPKSASAIEPWTDKQLDAMVALIAWACRTHDIPAVAIPDSKPGRSGIGYHRLGIDPWRVAGGERWSTSRGKECPGTRRIAQVPGIISRVQLILSEDTVDQKDVDRIARAVGDLVIPNKNPAGPSGQSTIVGSIVDIERSQDVDRITATQRHTELMTALGNLTTAVQALTSK